MTDQDKKEFACIMHGLSDNFRDNVSKEGMKFRFNMLRDYTIKQITRAAEKIVKSRKYTKFPTVGDFISAIEGEESDKKDLKADEQAYKVINAAKIYGQYRNISFADPTTQRIVLQHSWRKICGLTEKEIPFFVNEFKKSYIAEKNVVYDGDFGQIESVDRSKIQNQIKKIGHKI